MADYQPPEIVRTEDFIVANAVKNTYGDLLVTTMDGKPHKIGRKREQLFPIFQEGVSVHVCYASYMNKEYIADAVQSDQVVRTAALVNQAQKETPTPETALIPKPKPPSQTRGEEITENMWWKLLGEAIFTKDIDVAKPEGKALRQAFYAKMFSNIKIEKKEG